MTGLTQQVEELLEHLWTQREDGVDVPRELPAADFDFPVAAAAEEARRRGWISPAEDATRLTSAGELRAAGVIRRHRLAERLLLDVIQVDQVAMEAAACELEHSHILSEEATDRVCAFLGHPPTCPHDRPIPPGNCCNRFSSEVRPLVTPLSDGKIGGDYRIVFVATRSHHRLDRLCALGIAPGASLHLHQTRPAFIVQAGGTDIAIESDIAADVFVVPL